MKRTFWILALLFTALTLRAQVISQTPIVRVFGHVDAVYDIHLFDERYRVYRNRGQSEYLASQLAAGDAQQDIEARFDQAQKAIREASPEFYDAMMRHYGLDLAVSEIK